MKERGKGVLGLIKTCIHILFVIILMSISKLAASQDSLNRKLLDWSFFLDAYYSYDFNQPASHQKPGIFYNHNRHNEISINLALAQVTYNDSNTRASLGFMAGTYPRYNLATEPEIFRHLYEANLGFRISKEENLWIDAGIMPSHIGFESAISKECGTLTRSIAAENSPYYEAGIKLSYTSSNEKWLFAGLLLNGWQRIARLDGNHTPAFGSQVKFSPTSNLTFNYSTFLGNVYPDSLRRWRYFNNFFGIIQVGTNLEITMGLDAGMQQQPSMSQNYHYWYSPQIIFRYERKSGCITARVEYYKDKNAVIIPKVQEQPIHAVGYSINIDKYITKKLTWRVEARKLRNKTPFFTRGLFAVQDYFSITTNLSFSMDYFRP